MHGEKLEEAEDFKCVFIVYCVLIKLYRSAILRELRARDLIFTTDLQKGNYYSTIHY